MYLSSFTWHSTKTTFLWVRRENAPFLLFTFFGIYVYFLSFVMMYSCVWLHIDIFDIAPFFFSIRHFDVIQRARAVVFSSICRFILLFYFSLFFDVVKGRLRIILPVEIGLKLCCLFPAGSDNSSAGKRVHSQKRMKGTSSLLHYTIMYYVFYIQFMLAQWWCVMGNALNHFPTSICFSHVKCVCTYTNIIEKFKLKMVWLFNYGLFDVLKTIVYDYRRKHKDRWNEIEQIGRSKVEKACRLKLNGAF